MKISFVKELAAGYLSLEALLQLKGFATGETGTYRIPPEYRITTDGKLWQLLKDV